MQKRTGPESRTDAPWGSQILEIFLTRFLHANRYPLRLKTLLMAAGLF
jgi:hypothetical protein